MMGPGIALTLAAGGVRTTILSRSAEGARKGLEAAEAQSRLLEKEELLGAAEGERARALLDASPAFEETVARVDLVIESAPENMEFKQALFVLMDELARPETLLASNTSGLSITEIASGCGRPERD